MSKSRRGRLVSHSNYKDTQTSTDKYASQAQENKNGKELSISLPATLQTWKIVPILIFLVSPGLPFSSPPSPSVPDSQTRCILTALSSLSPFSPYSPLDLPAPPLRYPCALPSTAPVRELAPPSSRRSPRKAARSTVLARFGASRRPRRGARPAPRIPARSPSPRPPKRTPRTTRCGVRGGTNLDAGGS